MLEFGDTLRKAREAKGYTVSQLAEATHILPQIIENLEREDFSRIMAPIYGRGFVKLYCEAVGIEAKPMVDEFMEIFTGKRPPVIRLKETPAVEAAKPPVVETVKPTVVEAAKPPVTPVPVMEEPKAEEPPPAPRRDYRAPGRYSYTPDIPRRYWRIGILIVGAIAITALVVLAARTLYKASMTATDESAQKVEKPVKNSVPRNPKPVAPLYID